MTDCHTLMCDESLNVTWRLVSLVVAESVLFSEDRAGDGPGLL